jgi:tetratricopeptide (TPR) repeat protein
VAAEVFVSYSSHDRDVVWQLMAGLRRSGAIVWDYTRVGAGIPLGVDIEQELRRRVEAAGLFLPVVTSHSLHQEYGKWARFETSCALQRLADSGSCTIIPVINRGEPAAEFAGTYLPLANVFRLMIDASDPAYTEAAIKRLCIEARIDYVPPIANHAVLVRQRFYDELNEIVAAGVPISVAQRLELEDIVEFFNEAFTQTSPNWEAILDGISAFLYKTRREQLGSWYYPLVMRGLCQLECGGLESAERSFRIAAEHPRCDEHAFGGLGFVAYRRGQTHEAVSYLNRALAMASNGSWELKLDILTVLFEAGQAVDVESVIRGVDLAPLSISDWVKVMNLRGAVFCDRGMFADGERVLAEVWKRQENGNAVADSVTAIYLAQALQGLKRTQEAIGVLRSAADRLQDANLFHHLASVLWEAGRQHDSLEVFASLMAPEFRRRRYAIGYARRLSSAGRGGIAGLCRQVLDTSVFGLPQSAEEFWFCGFAHFLLGEYQLAEHDRQRGLTYSPNRYEEIEPGVRKKRQWW